MAKIVIAGKSNCPYFARIELLADALAKNLPNFEVHKILIVPDEWEEWLKKTCDERNWTHKASPIVWRELVDRGGKGLYMGGANELQEYAKSYYNLTSEMISDLQLKIAEENLQYKNEIDAEKKMMWVTDKIIKVCISNASHPTCYHLVHHLMSGEVFGRDMQISLKLLTNEEDLELVEGMEMEIMDLSLPLVRETSVTTVASESLKDTQVIVVLDEVEKNGSEPLKSWLKRNKDHFENLGKLINEHADKDVKIIIGGDGPVNYNADIVIKNAPKIPSANIVALSRTLENQAKALISQKLNVNSAEVVDVVVWGDPSTEWSDNFVDICNARVHNYDGAIWGPPFYSRSCVEMLHDNKWIATEFPQQLQQRRKTTEEMLNHRMTMSSAASIQTLLKHWCNGSPEDQVFSLGVKTDDSTYDIPNDIVFSRPVRFSGGSWKVADNLEIDDETKQKIKDVVQAVKNTYNSRGSKTPSRAQTPSGNRQNNNSLDASEQSELTQTDSTAENQIQTEVAATEQEDGNQEVTDGNEKLTEDAENSANNENVSNDNENSANHNQNSENEQEKTDNEISVEQERTTAENDEINLEENQEP